MARNYPGYQTDYSKSEITLYLIFSIYKESYPFHLQ